MSLRNYIKKMGKRAAGSWGRINHPDQMRAESKFTRKYMTEEEKEAFDDVFKRMDHFWNIIEKGDK